MHVFTYGTLMFSEVWRAVIGRRYRQATATVDGFQRRAIDGVDYPCLIRTKQEQQLVQEQQIVQEQQVVQEQQAAQEQQVEGILYFNVNGDDLERLDEFEADQYNREIISCVLANGETVEAFAYLWAERYMDQVQGEWDADAFKREGLHRFLARHGG